MSHKAKRERLLNEKKAIKESDEKLAKLERELKYKLVKLRTEEYYLKKELMNAKNAEQMKSGEEFTFSLPLNDAPETSMSAMQQSLLQKAVETLDIEDDSEPVKLNLNVPQRRHVQQEEEEEDD